MLRRRTFPGQNTENRAARPRFRFTWSTRGGQGNKAPLSKLLDIALLLARSRKPQEIKRLLCRPASSSSIYKGDHTYRVLSGVSQDGQHELVASRHKAQAAVIQVSVPFDGGRNGPGTCRAWVARKKGSGLTVLLADFSALPAPLSYPQPRRIESGLSKLWPRHPSHRRINSDQHGIFFYPYLPCRILQRPALSIPIRH